MSTTITPEEVQAMELYLLVAPTFKYISCAAATLFTWDLILTFPHEVRLWNTKWTLAKALFFLNRYFSFGTVILMIFLTFDVTPTDAISQALDPYLSLMETSGTANAFFGVITLLLVANIEVILQHRLYALYGYDRRIVFPVSALFIIVFSAIMVMAVIVYRYEKDHEAQIFGACCIVSSVDWLYFFWVPMIGLDFVLVMLAGYKSLQHYLQVPDKTWSGARLMRTFARDSILYFFCNFLVYLFNTFQGKFGSSQYYQLGAIMITVIPPMTANRLLINMFDSARTKQPSWTPEIKASQPARDASSVYHEVIELTYMDMKGSQMTEASSLDHTARTL